MFCNCVDGHCVDELQMGNILKQRQYKVCFSYVYSVMKIYPFAVLEKVTRKASGYLDMDSLIKWSSGVK